MAKGKYQAWLTPEALTLLSGWARDGATDEILAKKMGINVGTLYEWKKTHPEIAEALKKNKEVADIEIESALFRRAKGYKTEEEIVEKMPDGEMKMRRVRKEVPPDTAAAIFWLCNRQPGKWRQKPTNEDNTTLQQLDALLKEFRDATK